ncbi:thyroid transcription factor 1-associated protein 26 homolog [Hippocampus zosterae]|uniref:thyroid transcription factor 1-associated protein 26 homolog n=1 Tax=Hippocampus zosterae TaxID=109293 RepID=UPI00223D0065|nr:thyroid transcription factor 1-associated protein 26 homolog [Hippocampus zosterae]
MAPTHAKWKPGNLPQKEGNWKKPQKQNAVVKKKKWVPVNKVFQGSIKEGQGFAFERKEKVKHEYNKILRKEKKKTNKQTSSTSLLYRDEYPEHLKHLYMAEAEKLRKEVWTNRVNRVKLRKKGQGQEKPNEAEMEEKAVSEPKDAGPSEAENTEQSTSVSESLPLSNRMKKKLDKKTSYQRSLEECERVRETQRKKKEEFLKRKQQREESIRKYKEKKMEMYQMLCKKTKKGQPNLNLQMDYLLQKIQKISEATPKK